MMQAVGAMVQDPDGNIVECVERSA
jgi:hypothetical protein